MIYPIRRAIFNAAARGEYGGRTKTDRWVLGRKNHFFEIELFVCFLILLLFSSHKSQRENLRALALALL